MNCAIVALVRGYKSNHEYEQLITRNIAINETINTRIKNKFPLILFHEGNISSKQQQYVIERSKANIKFIDVSKEFIFEKSILSKAIDLNRFNVGYRLMCRFNFYSIWNYVSEYEYIIRIDEDVIIKKFDIKNLESINNKNIFSTISLSKESHVPTNETLPFELMKIFQTNTPDFYNHRFPYTNFYISRVDFWLRKDVNQNLKKLLSDYQIIYRWGDLPILGSFLNFYEKEIKILNNSKYYHSSHNSIISSKNFQNFFSKK